MTNSPHEHGQEKTITLVPHATALTIAGSDPSGGAGLQADLKTFQQFGVYGMSVVTLITVQNTQSVDHVEPISPKLIAGQIDAVLDDIPPNAIKTGAIGDSESVEVIADKLQNLDCPVIVDPVMVSKHGQPLVSDDVVDAYREHLIQRAVLLTPNRFEAETLTGLTLDSESSVAEAIARLQEMGAKHVLIKLGEADGNSQHILSLDGENCELIVPRLPTNNTHGSGCVLSAVIAARFALGESDLQDVVSFAIEQTYQAIAVNTELGKGIHPAETRAMGE